MYLHVPLTTLRYWTLGKTHERPLVKIAKYHQRQPLLSFKNLVECYVLEILRIAHGIAVQRIRYALETALAKYPSQHPFADYDLSTERNRIYLDEQPLTDLSIGGQFVFREFVGPSLKRVQRNHKGIAERLYPFMKKSQITQAQHEPPRTVVIDPAVSFGMPVLANSRISTAFLASRYRGGDSIPILARDYGRKEREIEEALVWERAKQAA